MEIRATRLRGRRTALSPLPETAPPPLPRQQRHKVHQDRYSRAQIWCQAFPSFKQSSAEITVPGRCGASKKVLGHLRRCSGCLGAVELFSRLSRGNGAGAEANNMLQVWSQRPFPPPGQRTESSLSSSSSWERSKVSFYRDNKGQFTFGSNLPLRLRQIHAQPMLLQM